MTQTETATTARNSYEDTPIFDTILQPKLLRDVVENDIYLLGGQFAILCQFANPALAKGTFKHSSFATRIPQRLRNTARFLNAAVCGTPKEKAAIFSVIHKYHARVKGDDYDANDPELQKWTAATLFVSVLVVRETFFGKVPPEEMETLFKESAVFGTSLRMPPEMWPETLDEFWAYWNHNIATLEVTDEARKLCQDLLYPSNVPLKMAVMFPFARILTVNWLPERMAQEYRLQPTLLSRASYHALVTYIRTIYPIIPTTLRQLQHQEYMEDLQKAVERIDRTGHWAGL